MRQGFNFADELAKGVVISERVPAICWKFIDIVASGKDSGVFWCAENDGADLVLFQRIECGRDFIEEIAAKGIDAAMNHGDGADSGGD